MSTERIGLNEGLRDFVTSGSQLSVHNNKPLGCSLCAVRDFILAKIELENRKLASLCTNILSNVDIFKNFRADSVRFLVKIARTTFVIPTA